MGEFIERLGKSSQTPKRWHYVAYDQLNIDLLPEHDTASELGLVFIETSWKASQLPYHKQKLALLLSNKRNFAIEMKDLGYPIHYEFGIGSYESILEALLINFGQISVCEPAELMLRTQLQRLHESQSIHMLPHKGWLTS